MENTKMTLPAGCFWHVATEKDNLETFQTTRTLNRWETEKLHLTNGPREAKDTYSSSSLCKVLRALKTETQVLAQTWCDKIVHNEIYDLKEDIDLDLEDLPAEERVATIRLTAYTSLNVSMRPGEGFYQSLVCELPIGDSYLTFGDSYLTFVIQPVTYCPGEIAYDPEYKILRKLNLAAEKLAYEAKKQS